MANVDHSHTTTTQKYTRCILTYMHQQHCTVPLTARRWIDDMRLSLYYWHNFSNILWVDLCGYHGSDFCDRTRMCSLPSIATNTIFVWFTYAHHVHLCVTFVEIWMPYSLHISLHGTCRWSTASCSSLHHWQPPTCSAPPTDLHKHGTLPSPSSNLHSSWGHPPTAIPGLHHSYVKTCNKMENAKPNM